MERTYLDTQLPSHFHHACPAGSRITLSHLAPIGGGRSSTGPSPAYKHPKQHGGRPGLAAENVHLQAIALGLGTGSVGAFSDDEVKKLLNLADKEVPLYILPAGKQ